MLNIQINKLLKMEGGSDFAGLSRKEERHNLKSGEAVWRGELKEGDVLKIKTLQTNILKIVEDIKILSKDPSLNQSLITNLEVKKLALIKERNLEGNKLPEADRRKLEDEIMADFRSIN